MRAHWCGAMVLGTVSTLLAGTPGSARIGIYHWGGRVSHSVGDGVETITALGGHVARIALSARYRRDYNMASDCRPGFNLTAAAQDPDVRRALENPEVDVFLLTVYDGATWGDCGRLNFLDPEFFSPEHTAAVIQEYSDFTLYLYRSYQATHKRFILSNWESDNSVYCGAAYDYATSAAFRETCRSQYHANYGVASPDDGLRGIKLWFDARARGILEGRQRALAEGLGGMRVYHAPEFNIVRALHDRGFESVLYDVLPSVAFDYISYSAWESLAAPDPAAQLAADLDIIQTVAGSSAIIVGEAGYLRAQGARGVDQISRIVSTALQWGVAYIIHWQLYDADPQNQFGLYDVEGSPTLLRDWFQAFFAQSNGSAAPGGVIPPVPGMP